MKDMVITLQGTAEQLIQRLVAQGAFPSAESAVSSLPHSGEAKVVKARLATLPRLPDPIFD